MANYTLQAAAVFPDGTSVGAYLASGQSPSLPGPLGSAANTQTISGGTCTFTGLTQGESYVAIGSVSGTYKRISFALEAPDPPDFTVGAAELEDDAVDTDAIQDGAVTLGKLTASLREPVELPWLAVEDFGAVGDGVADDSAAIQGAIDAAVAVHGAVYFSAGGEYKCDSTLDLDDARSVALIGSGHTQWDQTPRVFYTADAGNLISAKSSHGIRISGLRIEYTHTDYDGDLINFDHSVAVSDPDQIVIENCLLAGNGGLLARSLIRLNKSIIVAIRDCEFANATVGIRGRDPDYSNVVEVTNCTFVFLSDYGIRFPGESWTIAGNTFEPGHDGSGAGVFWPTDGGFSQGLVIAGNWFGDISTGAGPWIENLFALGAQITGNRFADPGPDAGSAHISIYLAEGVFIGGNRFENGDYGVVFQDAGAISSIAIIGNDIAVGVEAVHFEAAQDYAWVALGNDGLDNFIGGGSGLDLVGPLSLAGTTYIDGGYIAEPDAPAADTARVFFRRNPIGGTDLQAAVRFPSGVSQVFAREDGYIDLNSAATIAIPAGFDFVQILGTTNITSVTAGFAGQRVTLKFAGILTFTDGLNLKLAGDFTTSADDTLSLICDGTDWIETARSAN